MKHIAIIAALCAAPLAMAQGTPVSASEVQVEVVEAAINELCDIQVKIVELLETAKDKASADAAAEELFLVIARVHELQPDASKVKQCDGETQQRLISKLLKVTFSVSPRKKAVGKSLMENDFYGSEDLKEAMRLMM